MHAYPSEFRREYAREMERAFEARLSEEPQLTVWIDSILDVIVNAPREHLHVVRGDLRHAVRVFAKSPAFTLAALLTIALGVGATTAVFSLINAVLLRPLPYADAGRLVYMWTPNPHLEGVPREMSPPYADVFAWRESSRSFSAITALNQVVLSVDDGGESARIACARVFPNFFETMGAQPARGRGLDSNDSAVISAE